MAAFRVDCAAAATVQLMCVITNRQMRLNQPALCQAAVLKERLLCAPFVFSAAEIDTRHMPTVFNISHNTVCVTHT